MFEAYLCAGVRVNETAVTGAGLEVDEGRGEPGNQKRIKHKERA